MKTIPSYTKIMTLGSRFTENALIGEVIVQEKVDGSQFKFGINEEGQLVIGSKNTIISVPEENKMFANGVKYILSIKDKILTYGQNTYFYGEYLQKPKHNVLKYERTPKNNIVLFDVMCCGRYLTREELQKVANYLDIDLIPELYKGLIKNERIDLGNGGYKMSNIDFLKRIIETTPSYLGNEKIEGVVIKNYKQTILLGGNVFPLFTKYVREAFKERHEIEWKTKHPKDTLQDYINGFKMEARWQKAIIHLKEKGELTNTPKDIGSLIKLVQKDIEEEEIENIKNYLYKTFIKDILRTSVKGLPEWYKEKLLENLKE